MEFVLLDFFSVILRGYSLYPQNFLIRDLLTWVSCFFFNECCDLFCFYVLVDNTSFVLIFLASASPTVSPAKDIKFTNETINNSLKTAADANRLCCSQTSNDLPENIKDISNEKYYLSPAESKARQNKRENEQNSTGSSSMKGTFQHWFCTSHIT